MAESNNVKPKSLQKQFYSNFAKTPYGFVKFEGKYGNFAQLNNEYKFLVLTFGELPQNTITLYHKPKFEDFTTYQEMDEWLEKEGSYPNSPIRKKQYEKMAFNVLLKYIQERKNEFIYRYKWHNFNLPRRYRHS